MFLSATAKRDWLYARAWLKDAIDSQPRPMSADPEKDLVRCLRRSGQHKAARAAVARRAKTAASPPACGTCSRLHDAGSALPSRFSARRTDARRSACAHRRLRGAGAHRRGCDGRGIPRRAACAPIRRRVALKVLKFGLATRDVLARFELERQSLAIMSHPNIARMLDAGVNRGWSPVFRDGVRAWRSQSRAFARNAYSISSADSALFREVCAGVHHAHLRGVIHRDLKPSNILVSEIDGSVRPEDHRLRHRQGDQSVAGKCVDAHTRLGNLLGTPEYMSPEQAQLSPLWISMRAPMFTRSGCCSTNCSPGLARTRSRATLLGRGNGRAQQIVSCEVAPPSRRPRETEGSRSFSRRARTPAGRVATLPRGQVAW
jgi:hypothetical protein